VLNNRNDQLVALFTDADTLFQAISARRDSIHRLLVSTQQISAQLRGLVKDTRSELLPALQQLDTVTDMLRKNEASIDETLRVYPGFTRVFANAAGTGPWLDGYIGGLTSVGGLAEQLSDQVAAALEKVRRSQEFIEMSVLVPVILPVRRSAFTTRCRWSTSATTILTMASGSPAMVKNCCTSGTARTISLSSAVSVSPDKRISVNASS
jgi:hypothetical protein